MAEPDRSASPDLRNLGDVVKNLEARVRRLELQMEHAPLNQAASIPPVATATGRGRKPDSGETLEMQIGERGLAWAGSAVFMLGLAFVIVYAFRAGYSWIAGMLGCVSAAGLYLLGRSWLAANPLLGGLLTGGSLLLLYFTTVRLHFFSASPLVESRIVAIIALMLVVAAQLKVAWQLGSMTMAGVALVCGYAAATFADSTHATLPLLALLSALAVGLGLRQRWYSLIVAAVPLTYGVHALWLMNNPAMGHPMQAVNDHQYNLVYLALYAAIFAVPVLYAGRDSELDPAVEAVVFLNGVSFSAVLFLAVFALFPETYARIYTGGGLYLLLISVVLWLRCRRSLEPAIYAGLGSLLLSVAIHGYTGIPRAYLWYALQSLLVVSLALWFRSKMLVVVNSIIYLAILLAYVGGSPTMDAANFSFALVAHVTARIMNWKKERLTLRTEGLRNLYLAIGMVFLLYALYRAVPPQYVTLTFVGVASTYFLLSVWLHNIKYRWMSVSTVVVSVLYLLLFDAARLAPEFRAAAFLSLGLIAVAISLFYTRFRLRESGPHKKI